MLKTALYASLIAGLSAAAASFANAGVWLHHDGVTTVWVTVKSRPGETPWQTCRRLYQRDAYGARRLSNTTVRCRIDHSRIYDYQPRRQNFN